MIRIFAMLSVVTFFFFVLLGLAGLIQSKIPASPGFSMKGFASSLSTEFFLDMMGMELPYINKGERPSSFSQKNVSWFVFKFLTDVNPHDPKSLMAREVPGMNKEQMIVLGET
ncbi:MAG TPA: stage II sporulation protein P, partial [Bacilli bacterium]